MGLFKKAKKTTEENKELSTNLIGIRIYRPVSDDLVALAAMFTAEEKTDENVNLLAINQDKKYKEDHSFSKDRVYEVLEYSLNLDKGNKTKRQKEEVLTTKIREKENLLIKLETDKDENVKHNYADEDLKLRQLRVLKDSLLREKKGNYMRLGANGRREYEFISLDGVLYPYHFGSKIFRVYPDLTVKKKIFNHENTVFNNELNHNRENKIFTIGMIILLCSMAFLSLNLFIGYKLHVKSTNLDVSANNGVIVCQDTLAMLQSKYGVVIGDYLDTKKADLEMLKKNQNYINNNGGSISIDPSQILPN